MNREVIIQGDGTIALTRALKRCIGNLIDNAVNYGYRAKICVEDSKERLIIRILDQGPGIPEDRLKKNPARHRLHLLNLKKVAS